MAIRHSIDLNELLEGSWMEQARQRARIRLIDSIQSKEGVQVAGGDIHTEEGRLVEAFSFYYARLVMCASEDERLIARWAQAEAARAEQLLTQDLGNLRTVANTYLSQVETTHTTPTAPLSDFPCFDAEALHCDSNSTSPLHRLSSILHRLSQVGK